MIIAAMTLERFFSSLLNFLFWGSPVILFIVFLILFIVNLVKLKKGNGKKGKTIAFGVLTAVFLMYSIGEALLMIMLASAVAHM